MIKLNSYYQYLNRNKLFTAVNLAGLSISLMFVLLIANMVSRQFQVEKNQKEADNTYLAGNEYCIGSHYLIGEKLSHVFPEIQEWCALNTEGRNNSEYAIVQDRKYAVNVMCVRENFFEFFNYRLLAGNPAEVLRNKTDIVLTRSTAIRLFGTEQAEGKRLHFGFNEKDIYIVTGIVEDFDKSLIHADIDVIAQFDNVDHFNWSSSRHNEDMNNVVGSAVFFRFPKGYDVTQKLPAINKWLKENIYFYKEEYVKNFGLVGLKDIYFNKDEASGLQQYDFTKVLIFIISGILILLMAIFNYTSMNTAQISYRAKEMASRRLLGASQKTVFWRIVCESGIFIAVAFVIGFLLAWAAEDYASGLLHTRLDLTGELNLTTIIVYILALLLITATASFIPATLLSRYNPLDIVKGTFRRKTKAVYLRGLYIIQSGLTVAMLTCSVFLSVQIWRILHEPLGYTYHNIIDYSAVGNSRQSHLFRSEALKKPFVKQVCLSCGTPNDRGNNNTVPLEDDKGNQRQVSFQLFQTDSAFVEIFGIEMLERRNLAKKEKSSMLFADNFFDEMGMDYEKTDRTRGGWEIQVAGKFRKFRIGNLLDEAGEAPEGLVQSLIIRELAPDSLKRPWNILVQTIDGDKVAYKKELDDLYAEILDGIPFDSKWYEDEIKDSYADLTRLKSVMFIFTGAALVISLLGLTAMSVYFISQRKRDIAIRKVFGSTSANEQVKLMKFSFYSTCWGLVLAIPLTIYGIHHINKIVTVSFGFPWWVPVVSFVGVTLISLASVWFISRRAVRENPINNLKTE
ncbi:ABC transporter permease [uncultured Bacteroides sp.]|uniref:ABC transporter permease n=1 Tax=uncultured Bacteroides sp. TaxID=162156 RepID=UPI002609041D|nr:ABC transporter permease [uncultured Bacteroides sp.]